MSGSRSTGGREFQHDGLDEENARRPRVTLCVRGTNIIPHSRHQLHCVLRLSHLAAFSYVAHETHTAVSKLKKIHQVRNSQIQKIKKLLGHMKNTRRNTCTGVLHFMQCLYGLTINFRKTKTNTNPNPDHNRYRRRCPDHNARIEKFRKDCVSYSSYYPNGLWVKTLYLVSATAQLL